MQSAAKVHKFARSTSSRQILREHTTPALTCVFDFDRRLAFWAALREVGYFCLADRAFCLNRDFFSATWAMLDLYPYPFLADVASTPTIAII
jgi:hypothetical protein